MAEREIRERDILVAANEYAYVQDLTKGDIVLYVGPTKISLSNTERLVELRGDRFAPARGDESSAGVQPFVVATSAQYIILENPPKDGASRPVKGSNSAVELLTGRRVVVPGPVTFPLWPGQRARVIDGHRLREDEYLVVRVYDRVEDDDGPIGTERVVRGADVSFYLPRTGLEVVPHAGGFVRRAWRLHRGAGLHLRVLKGFVAGEGGQLPPGAYAAGQDLFLADREGFFFPTEAIEVVAAVAAIPIEEGAGIHVRDIESGRIATVLGPRTYLPDPTRVEVVGQPAVTVIVPPNHAVMVTARNRREVVRGPQLRILNHDEALEELALSTGRPKSDETLLATSLLQLEGNKVSDVVRLETADHVGLEVSLSYRVSFIARDGVAEKWFNVKNYVGLLCDHLGSLLRAAARTVGIDAFHAGGTDVLRNALLGEKIGDGKRAGRLFEENDMWLYDVEVLDVGILDADVEELLAGAQRTAIGFEIERRQEELRLGTEILRADVTCKIHQAQIAASATAAELASAQRDAERAERIGKAAIEADAMAVLTAARIDAATQEQAVALRRMDAEVKAFEQQMAAMAPELIATLTNLGNQRAAAELTRNLSPLAILGGDSVADVAGRLLAALPIGARSAPATDVLALPPANGAGKGETPRPPTRKG